jgi:hypothetical protein
MAGGADIFLKIKELYEEYGPLGAIGAVVGVFIIGFPLAYLSAQIQWNCVTLGDQQVCEKLPEIVFVGCFIGGAIIGGGIGGGIAEWVDRKKKENTEGNGN